MPSAEAHVTTPAASQYLQQLCKHWGHKLKVEFTPHKGRVEFAPGRVAHFEAAGNDLKLRVDANDEAELTHTETVVINHLKRFAFREDLGAVEWTPEKDG